MFDSSPRYPRQKNHNPTDRSIMASKLGHERAKQTSPFFHQLPPSALIKPTQLLNWLLFTFHKVLSA